MPSAQKNSTKGAKVGWKKDSKPNDVFNYTLCVQDVSIKEKICILDSGSSRHLVNDAALLEDASEWDDKCLVVDGKTLQLSMVVSVMLRVMAVSKPCIVRITDVYYAPMLARNILSYGKLELKGCGLVYENGQRTIRSFSTGGVIFDIAMQNNVLIVETQGRDISAGETGAIMTVTTKKKDHEEEDYVQRGSLMHFHRRFGHLSCDTIERMTREPGSGIELTDHQRMVCITCAQSNQPRTRNKRKIRVCILR